MNESPLRQRWDERYRDAIEPGAACYVLHTNRHLLPATGIALDLASGLGANALLLAQSGLNTEAWDISPVALAKLGAFARARQLSVATQERDVEAQPPPHRGFDVIVVSHFLHRSTAATLPAALKSGGLLFYQTFTQQKLTATGPSSEEFLLAPNELLRCFGGLEVRYYREDGRAGDLTQGLRDCAYFVGQAPR